jgi:hypothetical protein
VGGKYVTSSERGRAEEVYRAFAKQLALRFNLDFYHPRGSQSWINQMAFANKVITIAAKFLGYNGRKDVDPTEFAVLVIEEIFVSSSGSWIAQEPTILRCNGGTFYNHAPSVLRRIEAEEKKANAEGRRLRDIQPSLESLDVHYAI